MCHVEKVAGTFTTLRAKMAQFTWYMMIVYLDVLRSMHALFISNRFISIRLQEIFSCDNVLFSDTFSWSYYVYIHSSCVPMQQQQVFGSLYIIFSHFKLTVCTRLLEIEGINYIYWHGNQLIFQSQSLFLDDYRLHRKQYNFYKFLGAHHNSIHVWTKEFQNWLENKAKSPWWIFRQEINRLQLTLSNTYTVLLVCCLNKANNSKVNKE